ncbi:hypothetical protein [Sphingomonas nostoxanthinifaciens]|uniref:hypothetical protein n=1 Tax=Sphingomonas nostoxanthinifaciens TaxID=2872652 RepID=UPI001CC21FF9|nr:hypothetical protein [Sphingomonas nostoxanthinifaciens]UAK23292.1 hypothetical protein K8P63_12870 [Sphingomonas nostoxanthinifaciens]
MTPGPSSRYARQTIQTYVAPDGEMVPYIGRRVIPDMDRYQPLDRHRTVAAERIDQVADGFYGDPLQYWRVCDANGVERPAEACMPAARLLVIPLPLELSGG